MLDIKELGVQITFHKGWMTHPRLNEERYSYSCSMLLPDGTRDIAFAYLNPIDNNNKKLGKIIALRKVMERTSQYFNRQQRSLIWDEFWDWVNK
jgi:hypothetical protein